MEYFNHSIDFLHRVVKVEARASCSRHPEPTHQRLVTMMSAAHGQPILVRERSQIVRMRCVHDKPNQRAAFFPWTKDASARQFADALGCIMRKVRVMFENRRSSDLLDVINRSGKADGSRYIWRSGLEPM